MHAPAGGPYGKLVHVQQLRRGTATTTASVVIPQARSGPSGNCILQTLKRLHKQGHHTHLVQQQRVGLGDPVQQLAAPRQVDGKRLEGAIQRGI